MRNILIHKSYEWQSSKNILQLGLICSIYVKKGQTLMNFGNMLTRNKSNDENYWEIHTA